MENENLNVQNENDIKIEENSEINEKPLSPVLSSNKYQRKVLYNRRKNRVRLSDRFQNVEEKTENISINIDDDSFTVDPSSSFLDRLNKLEEIENNRMEVYKWFVRSDAEKFNFKKPISPAPKVKIKHCSSNSQEDNAGKKDSEIVQEIQLVEPKNISMNFQTATGKNLVISETAIKNQMSLFEDILNPQEISESRINKHSFLSKSQLKSPEICLTQEICESGISNTQMLLAVDDFFNTIENFSGFTPKNIEESANKYDFLKNISNKFEEKLGLFPGFRNSDMEMSENKVDFLLQSCKVMEDALRRANGKNREEISCRSIYSISNRWIEGTKKHKPNDLELPPQKRQKTVCANNKGMIELELGVESKQEGDQKAFSYQNQRVFSSASGKKIEVSESSLKKAEKIFESLDKVTKLDEKITNQFSCSPERNITISEAAMSESNKAFESINQEQNCEIKTKLFGISQIGDNDSTATMGNIKNCQSNSSKSAIENANKFFCNSVELGKLNSNENEPRNNFTGFSCASGKSINLSKEAIEKANKMFENIDAELISKNIEEQAKEKVVPNLSKPSKGLSGVPCASGKKLNVSKSANKIFENIEMNEIEELSHNKTVLKSSKSFHGFSCASGKNINVSKGAMEKAAKIFENIDKVEDFSETNIEKTSKEIGMVKGEEFNSNKAVPNIIKQTMSFTGFSCASGKNIKISEAAVAKANKIFENIDIDNSGNSGKTIFETTVEKSSGMVQNIETNPSKSFGGFSCASGKNIKISKAAMKKANKIFDNIDDTIQDGKNVEKAVLKPSVSLNGFSCASGKNINISERALEKANKIFENIDVVEIGTDNNIVLKLSKPSRESRTDINISESTIKKDNNIIENVDNAEEKENLNKINVDSLTFSEQNISIDYPNSKSYEEISSIKNSTIIESKNIKEIIVDNKNEDSLIKTPINQSNKSRSSLKRLGISSCKQIPISHSKIAKAKMLFDEDIPGVSSPIRLRETVYASTPLKSTPVKQNIANSFVESPITPIRKDVKSLQNVQKDDLNVEVKDVCSSKFLFQEKSGQNVLEEFRNEQKILEEKLKIVLERLHVVEGQKHLVKSREEKRPKLGILSKSKKENNRISIRNYIKESNFSNEEIDATLLAITPQNALTINFKIESITRTLDEAVIVPDVRNCVGLNEIVLGFKSMPGVDEKWLPSGWIENHFKWIVWKFASYERMFPNQFLGCFNLENVIQQLKYRYDREIDKVERSALRKIYEKDDTPQKRMVLCISNIFQIAKDKFELELTDGWYAIRTVIDDPLCYQITVKKLVIGSKIITCDAELLNCDGCHPLDTTDLVKLKINFNCTRRAVWYTKLGYQSNPVPFPIKIDTIHSSGGNVGCVKLFLVRVYPIRYLDRTNQQVWRNRRAEERASQEWENERRKKLEEIQENVRKEFENQEKAERTSLRTVGSNTDFSNINCPRTLFEIVKSSSDPYSIQDRLTSTQQLAVNDYQTSLNYKKQNEMRSKIEEEASKLKLSKRNVVPMLQILVTDASCSTVKKVNLSIWCPTDDHLQILKENSVVIAYNLSPRFGNDLASTSKAKFKQVTEVAFPVEFSIFKRHLTAIGELDQINCDFNEFDTVGIVVQIEIGDYQEVWLADWDGRLLQITFYIGPKKCLVLDSLNRGQITSVCNITLKKQSTNFAEATGSFNTIFSSYSQFKHLQEGIELFNKKLPKNLNNLLQDCDNKISSYRCSNVNKSKNCGNFSNSTGLSDDSNEDGTLIYSRITSTDVALSMIDIDKFT